MKENSNEHVWLCLRTQPKHEHIASANLKRIPGIEIFCPRLRTRKLTRRGPVWMTDALFPNYLFARFEFEAFLEDVKYTPGISHIVHFGHGYPIVPVSVMEELRRNFGNEEVQVVDETMHPGDRVTIADPKLLGIEAIILRVLPAKQRIQVLIEMLGQVSTLELKYGMVVPANSPLPTSMLKIGESSDGPFATISPAKVRER